MLLRYKCIQSGRQLKASMGIALYPTASTLWLQTGLLFYKWHSFLLEFTLQPHRPHVHFLHTIDKKPLDRKHHVNDYNHSTGLATDGRKQKNKNQTNKTPQHRWTHREEEHWHWHTHRSSSTATAAEEPLSGCGRGQWVSSYLWEISGQRALWLAFLPACIHQRRRWGLQTTRVHAAS